MDATELLLRDHARTHSLAVGQPEGGISIIDAVVGGLDDDQIRRSPQAGMNSLAWLIWHMARSEDAGVNLLVAGRPQVLDAEGWLDRLRVSVHDIAAGMTDDEVSDFSTSVDIADLVAYRAAVGRRTCEVVAAMRPTALDEKIDGSLIERAFADGTFSENAGWLRGFMAGKSKAFVLGHVATGHNFMHLGEAWAIRSLLGLRLPI